MAKKKCAQCGRPIKPFMTLCYKCYHQKKGDYNPKKLQTVHGGSK